MIYSNLGVSHDPHRVESLVNMSKPRNAGELMQFICACQWFAPHIPSFAHKIAPLRNLLERLLQGSNDRSKKFAKSIPLSADLFDLSAQSAFDAVISALKHAVTLAHPNEDLEKFIFTDSSGGFYSIIVTQQTCIRASTPTISFLQSSFQRRLFPLGDS